MRNREVTGWAAIGVILVVIIVLLISPFLNFLEGWIIGWLIKSMFPELFLKGLSLLGLTLKVDQIPLLCGTLGCIGSFFRNTNINRKAD